MYGWLETISGILKLVLILSVSIILYVFGGSGRCHSWANISESLTGIGQIRLLVRQDLDSPCRTCITDLLNAAIHDGLEDNKAYAANYGTAFL